MRELVATPPRPSLRPAWIGIFALIGLISWTIPFSRWVGHNGDHFYYMAMALQFAGMPYTPALEATAEYFAYPFPASNLNYGFLNPQVAPLIYPRTALPLSAAPFIDLLGNQGIYVPGILAGIATVILIVLFARRMYGPRCAVLAALLSLLSHVFTEFAFGIYTESFAMLIMAWLVMVLPWRTPPASTWVVPLTYAALCALGFFVRQMALFPLALIGGAWLWAAVRERRLRNAWGTTLLAGLSATAVVHVLFSRWAPYDPVLFLRVSAQQRGGDDGLLAATVKRAVEAMETDLRAVLTADRATVIIAVLVLVALYRMRTTPLAGATVGVISAGLVTTMLNGTPTGFRYFAPALPLLVVLAASAVHRPSTHGMAEATSTRLRSASWLRVSAAAAVLCVVAVVAGTRVVYAPRDLDAGVAMSVSAATSDAWPIRDQAGRLVCVGSYEVWFVTESEKAYPFSGTAMARSGLGEKLLDRAREEVAYAWPASDSLLQQGIQLCDQARRN